MLDALWLYLAAITPEHVAIACVLVWAGMLIVHALQDWPE